MKIGVSVYNVTGATLLDIAGAAEQAGFDSLWLGEHLVLPFGYSATHPTREGLDAPDDTHFPRIVDPDTELLDPWVALSAAAARTSRIRLATGIYILPLRHPLLTARSAASLAELSGGRFMLGVGSGWLREEFEALDVPFAERGSRYEEILEVLRLAFQGGIFEYTGRHFHFPPVQVSPRPIDVSIVLGGNSDRALRRAARVADAWFASGTPTFDEAVRLRDRLEVLRRECGRADPIEAYFRMPAFDPSALTNYAAAGIDNVLFWAQDLCPTGVDDRWSAFRAFGCATRPRASNRLSRGSWLGYHAGG